MKIEDIKYDIPYQEVDEENFDIEKWRKEYPIDYFKLMYLINTSSDRDIAFLTIYRVIRMHIPDILYKYYSLTENSDLNEQKLNTILEKKVYMSPAKDLNDPFDSKAYYYDPNVLAKYKPLDAHGGKLIDDFSMLTKVCSFSKNGINSMPMWAHYSNNHTGFCISYDMKENEELSDCTFPVQYTSERIDITSLMIRQVEKILEELEKQRKEEKKEIVLDDLSLIYLTLYFCNIKHSSWGYENEFRCTIGSNKESLSYMPAKPKEIFIGANCSKVNVDKLIEVANKLQIPIYQMYLDDLNPDFCLLTKKIN